MHFKWDARDMWICEQVLLLKLEQENEKKKRVYHISTNISIKTMKFIFFEVEGSYGNLADDYIAHAYTNE